MKKIIFFIALLCTGGVLLSQNNNQDTLKVHDLGEITIKSNKMPISLKNNPGAVSLVTQDVLSQMPKTIAPDEALRLVPGVRIDNQHDGERVHISIRGQGILTERGLRGIGVLIDGIPLNDPSGFAPDLYDVDWATVENIEVLRGPSAGLYGSSGAGGVLNISTQNGVNKPLGGLISSSFGSNGFLKVLGQVGGTQGGTNYNLSFSRTAGDGFRDHQAFWGNNLYEKVNFKPSDKFSLTQIISHSDYFHQNPEGLSFDQLSNIKQANPDACPFNEYQKTNRTTFGFTATYDISKKQNIYAYSFLRNWKYKETSNKAAEYRNYTDPGAGIQYNLNFNTAKIKHSFSIGADYKYQDIHIVKFKSGSDLNRGESIDETNIELDTLLANQIINQESIGTFALYKFELGKFNLMANFRYDYIDNLLNNKAVQGDTAETIMTFENNSFRIGASYNFAEPFTIFVNFSQGFMPPSTEELASNPLGYSGFNTHLVPATSDCFETGFRGFINDKIYYDITAFMMNTENDFFRFKQQDRGNQEVFYGNAGNSTRYGLETYLSVDLFRKLNLQLAYTYSDFKYTSAQIDPVYSDTAYVLTIPPQDGQYLPNSPKHQLYSELTYSINKNFKLNVGVNYQSEWAIYTDAKAYNGELDPAIYHNWQNGFTLVNTRFSYIWKLKNTNGEFNISAKNLLDETYMAFTEPDPDGNSYQPGALRELFVNLAVKF